MKKILIALITIGFLTLGSFCWAAESPEADLAYNMGIFILQISIIIFAAWIGGEVFKRLNLPGVLGEIVAGVIIGPYCLGKIFLPGLPHGLFPPRGDFPISIELYAIATLASVILLFLTGCETDVRLLFKYSLAGSLVGLAGVIFSFVLGDLTTVMLSPYVFGSAYNFWHPIPLFLGVISSATSVGITARILSDKRKNDSPAGITIVSAAVIDDVLGIIVLAVIIGIARTGHFSPEKIVPVVFKALGIWLGFTAMGLIFYRQLGLFVKKFKDRATITIMSFAIALFLAGIFERCGLAMIIGSYVAGLSFSKTDLSFVIQDRLEVFRKFFVPIFFCVMGMLINLKELIAPHILIFGGAYLLAAILSKFLGCSLTAWLMNFNLRGAAAVGVGMIPRGEVALIVAGIGLSSGIVPRDVFSTAVLMTFVTTIVTPPILVKLIDTDKPLVKKTPETAAKDKEICYTMPNLETAELMLNKIIFLLEQESFYVQRLNLPDTVLYQIQKDETRMSLFYDTKQLVFRCNEREESFVHTLVHEVIADLEYIIKSLQKGIDMNLISKNIFNKRSLGDHDNLVFAQAMRFLGIECNLKGGTKEEITRELLGLLVKTGQVRYEEQGKIIEELLGREIVMSTALQDGIAIPHARTQAVSTLCSAIGIKKQGIDAKSLDGKPTQIFILTLIPLEAQSFYLQYISGVFKFLSNEKNRKRLVDAGSNKELAGILFPEKPIGKY